MQALFTNDPGRQGGSKIIDTLRTSADSVARNYTRNDVDPEGGSFTTVQAEWNKTYQEVAFEVHGIDQAESGNGGNVSISNLISDAAALAMEDMSALMWENLYTRIKADIDETAIRHGKGRKEIGNIRKPSAGVRVGYVIERNQGLEIDDP